MTAVECHAAIDNIKHKLQVTEKVIAKMESDSKEIDALFDRLFPLTEIERRNEEARKRRLSVFRL